MSNMIIPNTVQLIIKRENFKQTIIFEFEFNFNQYIYVMSCKEHRAGSTSLFG